MFDWIASVFCKTLNRIQITRSADPFAKHDTNTTCSDKSKDRISKLLDAASKAINDKSKFSDRASPLYVMVAPNTKDGKEAAPGQQEPYYFSPSPGTPAGGRGGAPERKRAKKGCCDCRTANACGVL